ncbi:polyprenyl synthetase family protein [Acetivibrio mesophilus]|uniref:Farnesyl diphosphate synthase n=1 Tax=Acetivibrio mesophilus TaxID=2487273 RepID=A0A4Q0I5T8_9FIRM|nr:farnesyl diphosphate synthase [Acetivibrio mesophilus]ODM25310.1 farnesyl-diphosphate synthase [Clostridium sp. Bc-iso-3]RXE59670.1 polyprenyl synthetase family protein [Acetivibrio mesophilus]HHV28609.1 polyprenyl synthetase family protein [Clostridium sp.]
MDFKQQLDKYVDKINEYLDRCITEKELPEKPLYSAMKYSIMAGGKRLRPVLSLAVCDMLDGNVEEVLPFACAVEMIHTYSLIHDDLPAMDNDDFRRGRPTNHKVYGEALAILAGDGLLNLAFETMLESIIKSGDKEQAARAAGVIATASGSKGMISGQVIDLESEGKQVDTDILNRMHRFKTGALIKAPVVSAAILCKAEADDIEKLDSFAENLGLAFQIKDDILDVEGNTEKLGKKVGSDADNNKSTYVSLYGLERSKEILSDVTKKAIASLEKFGEKAVFLKSLADYLLVREN